MLGDEEKVFFMVGIDEGGIVRCGVCCLSGKACEVESSRQDMVGVWFITVRRYCGL